MIPNSKTYKIFEYCNSVCEHIFLIHRMSYYFYLGIICFTTFFFSLLPNMFNTFGCLSTVAVLEYIIYYDSSRKSYRDLSGLFNISDEYNMLENILFQKHT